MPDTQKFNFPLFRQVMTMVRPYKRTFYFTALLTLILAPLAILRPKLLQIMVDDYVFQGDVHGMTLLACAILGALLLEVLMRYFFLYYADWIGQATIRDLRVRVFRHVTGLHLNYFDKTPIGQSTTRTINDIEAINTIFSEGSITILADLMTLTAVLFIMFYTSWKLTLVVLVVFPLLIWGSYKFKESVRKSYEKVRNHIATMNAFLQERITGMRIVQIFNAEAREAEKFRQINRDYTSANLRSILAYAIFFPVVDIISALSLGLMVWYGARGVLSEEVTVGVLVAFPLYISMLYRPIRMLADKFNTLQMGLIAAERVFKLLETEERIQNTGDYAPERLKGKVEFDDVRFSYSGDLEGDPILRGVSFTIRPGETLAIVGSTGSGKTTIISLLSRFYDVQEGRVLIDDRDQRDYDVFALRRRIAVVLQDVFLFSGTVLENITLRDADISEAEVIEAAKMIGAHRFIEKLPGGYHYQVRERGATLSMGQRQLISFVRALVFNPDILILDEATSSIDPESEAVIQHAIETLIAKRTSIIIAHRLSTIRHANNVMVLDKGKVVEFGSHDTLLEIEDGKYRELYEKQFVQVSNEWRP
ncbi:MAG: ABC transporter ATP-binding protein [Saprospiraceae bacterium]|nr:ABC transporter ATP-binding protein [Saprospiraceae bacterium]MCB0543147.1 ABC transporter ATP-binding protein [Saprospiraceae bacterium]MCB9353564.1 ABC transporter ATP-binding protein [Lewinellaceae bacterium]